ncbi:MAG: hypothetical protein ACJ8AW_25365, partial [Rhodopila sp.]
MFYVQRGTTTINPLPDGAPVHVTGATEYRSVSIQNGTLYASRDVNASGGAKITEIDTFATALPTSANSAATKLPGIGPSITVSASSGNRVNHSRLGNSAYLSPEDYLFVKDANGNQFLYIA